MSRWFVARVFLNAVVPVVTYTQLRGQFRNDTAALAVATAIPACLTVGRAAWRGRVDPIGTLSVLGFTIAVLASVLTGGSQLAIKLQDPVLTGIVGLACVSSVLAHRPLQNAILHLLGRYNHRTPGRYSKSIRQISGAETVVIGGIFLTHAAAIMALALSVSTATFLSLSRPVGLPIFGGGLGLLLWHRRHRVREPPEGRAAADIQLPPDIPPADLGALPGDTDEYLVTSAGLIRPDPPGLRDENRKGTAVQLQAASSRSER